MGRKWTSTASTTLSALARKERKKMERALDSLLEMGKLRYPSTRVIPVMFKKTLTNALISARNDAFNG